MPAQHRQRPRRQRALPRLRALRGVAAAHLVLFEGPGPVGMQLFGQMVQ
jgi:hypothetical protein